MLLLEVAMKGVRGLSAPLTRLDLEPGVNVVHVDDPELRARLLDIIFHTLHPDPTRSEATQAHVADGVTESRALLTYRGQNGQRHRIVRELETGAASLYEEQGDAGRYKVLSKTSTEVAQYLRVQENLPDEVAYERVFTLSADTMPALGRKVRSRSGRGWDEGAIDPVAPGMPTFGSSLLGGNPPEGANAAPPRTSFPSLANPHNALVQAELGEMPGAEEWSPVLTDEKRALYSELRRAVDEAERRAQGRERLDELIRRRDDMASNVERIRRLQRKAAELQHVEDDEELADLPDDIEDRIRGLDVSQARYEADVERLVDERTTAEDQYHEHSIVPLSSDKYFIAGLGTAIAAVVLSVGFGKPALALMNLPGALVAVGAAFRFINDLEGQARLRGRIEAIDERVAKLDKQYELETAVNRRLLEKLTIEPEDLLAHIEEVRERKQDLAEVEEELAVAQKEAGGAGAAEEFDRIEHEIDSLESSLFPGDVGASGASLEQMREKLRELGSELNQHGVSVVKGQPMLPEAPDEGATQVDEIAEEEGYGQGYGVGGVTWDKDDSMPTEGAPPGLFASGPEWSAGGPPFGGGGYGGAGASDSSDRSRALIRTGVDVLQTTIESLADGLSERMGQYVSALTDEVYEKAIVGPHGNVSFSTRSEMTTVAYTELGAPLVDLVDAAIRLTLMEASVADTPAPILIDDPFTHFDGRRRAMFRQMLGYLASATQIVVLSSASDIEGHALTLRG